MWYNIVHPKLGFLYGFDKETKEFNWTFSKFELDFGQKFYSTHIPNIIDRLRQVTMVDYEIGSKCQIYQRVDPTDSIDDPRQIIPLISTDDRFRFYLDSYICAHSIPKGHRAETLFTADLECYATAALLEEADPDFERKNLAVINAREILITHEKRFQDRAVALQEKAGELSGGNFLQLAMTELMQEIAKEDAGGQFVSKVVRNVIIFDAKNDAMMWKLATKFNVVMIDAPKVKRDMWDAAKG